MGYAFLITLGAMATILVFAALVDRPGAWCPKGGKHDWDSPAFRVRVCSKCRRREFFWRSWEFDGFEPNDQGDRHE